MSFVFLLNYLDKMYKPTNDYLFIVTITYFYGKTIIP